MMSTRSLHAHDYRGLGASWRSGAERELRMYLTSGAAVVLILLAVLMMLGVVPVSPMIVGVMFLLVALGFAGPFVVRAT